MTQVQIMLDGKAPVQKQTEEKPWKGVCCRRCWYAKTEKKKCRCRCHGVNHQEGLRRTVEGAKKLEATLK